jgi:hypothetical protein
VGPLPMTYQCLFKGPSVPPHQLSHLLKEQFIPGTGSQSGNKSWRDKHKVRRKILFTPLKIPVCPLPASAITSLIVPVCPPPPGPHHPLKEQFIPGAGSQPGNKSWRDKHKVGRKFFSRPPKDRNFFVSRQGKKKKK